MKSENKIVLYFTLGVYVFFSVMKLFLFFDLGLSWHLETSIFGLVALTLVAFTIRGIDIALDRLYPYERNIILRLLLQFFISIVFILTIRFFIFQFVREIIPIKLNKELWAAATIIHILSIVTLILTMFSYRFFNKWKETELKKEILEKEKATVQYDNLKNQLNPHFLFNSLTSLNSLIFENPQLASEFLQQLAKVYRYVLENNDKTLVSLSTEVKFISNYIKLLLSRFENGLIVNVKIEETDSDRKILPVTLQILIENAIKHNVISRDNPLRIDIYCDSAYLVVKNNLQSKHTIEDSNKQGLDNLKSLYMVLVEKEVIVEQTPDHFWVKIPLI